MSVMERYEKSGKSEKEVSDLCDLVVSDELPSRDEAYTRWANTYDEDLSVTYDYNGPAQTADEVARIFADKREANICDFGCGTGNVGVELNKRGYKSIDGLDANQAMLEVAKRKGIYKQLILGELGKGKIESIQDNTYDLLISAGSVCPNHITHGAFEELIRITKPGGNILCSTPASFLPKDFKLGYKQLEGTGAWKLVEQRTRPNFFGSEAGVFYNFEVLPEN